MQAVRDNIGFALAPFLCLLAPVLEFLTTNDYPVLSPETLPLLVAGVLPGLVAFGLALLSRPRLANTVVSASFVFAVFLNFDLKDPSWVLALVLATGLLVWLARRHAATLVATGSAALVGVTLAGQYLRASDNVSGTIMSPAPPPRVESTDLPPVLHIVLGELAGLHGLPRQLPESHRLARELSHFFAASDFTVYPNAFSQYSRTADSLPNLLNFKSSKHAFANLELRNGSSQLTENRYFEHLADLGYSIDVYQTDFLDFCNTPTAPVDRCQTYESNAIRALRPVGIDSRQKTKLIWHSLLDSSPTLRMLRHGYLDLRRQSAPFLPAWPAGNGKTGPLATIPTVAALRERLRSLDDGEAYFVHLLAPHYPYVYDSDCSVRPTIDSWLNRAPFEAPGGEDDEDGLDEPNSAESRLARYRLYLEQLACTARLLAGLFAAVRESGHWEEAVILVHGDHGARIFRRIPTIANRQELSAEDFRDAYSAFFAAKTPFTPAGIDETVAPLQSLLARSWNLPEPDIDEHAVYLIELSGSTLATAELGAFGDGK